MNIISDFSDIARRMNRKPEKVAAIDNSAAAAVKTLQSFGYTYEAGAEMWKPPLGSAPKPLGTPFFRMIEKLHAQGAIPTFDLPDLRGNVAPSKGWL